MNNFEIVDIDNVPITLNGVDIPVKSNYRYITVEVFYSLNHPYETTSATLDILFNILQVIPIPLYYSGNLITVCKFTNESLPNLQKCVVKSWNTSDDKGYLKRIIYH